ncbi:hypothetical protein LCGC14_1698290 [marine sediment metagenome]|uniref:Uncharacterized protein n=1 Tax=marine sediment metagenome TaxID=412755 RepID=A0A0F9I6D3_9ZZZZ
MKLWLLVFGLIYLGFLVWYSHRSWRRLKGQEDPKDFLFDRATIGPVLGFIGISATLFSTFTLQGMPAFFRNHGIAAWVFLGVTDVCLAAILLSAGLALRKIAKQAREGGVNNITDLLCAKQSPPWVRWTYVIVVTLFLIPYVTIQIKGASVLFQAAQPLGETHLAWSIIIVTVMLAYSCFGGIRAIFVTDGVQGAILLGVSWLLAVLILRNAGGMESLVANVFQVEPALLSAPGPAGLLGVQFLLISFISICAMPYVQPQLATRVLVVKDDRTFVMVAIGLSVFALFVILPTMVIGLRGVGMASDMPGGFLSAILSSDGGPVVHALFVIGVLAAAMSTSDSQLLAVGTEWGSVLRKKPIGEDSGSPLVVKIVAILVGAVALAFAQTGFRSLVLFSINSFIGTSYLLPAIIGASTRDGRGRTFLGGVSLGCVLAFVLVIFGVLPKELCGIRSELWLFGLAASCVAWVLAFPRRGVSNALVAEAR